MLACPWGWSWDMLHQSHEVSSSNPNTHTPAPPPPPGRHPQRCKYAPEDQVQGSEPWVQGHRICWCLACAWGWDLLHQSYELALIRSTTPTSPAAWQACPALQVRPSGLGCSFWWCWLALRCSNLCAGCNQLRHTHLVSTMARPAQRCKCAPHKLVSGVRGTALGGAGLHLRVGLGHAALKL